MAKYEPNSSKTAKSPAETIRVTQLSLGATGEASVKLDASASEFKSAIGHDGRASALSFVDWLRTVDSINGREALEASSQTADLIQQLSTQPHRSNNNNKDIDEKQAEWLEWMDEQLRLRLGLLLAKSNGLSDGDFTLSRLAWLLHQSDSFVGSSSNKTTKPTEIDNASKNLAPVLLICGANNLGVNNRLMIEQEERLEGEFNSINRNGQSMGYATNLDKDNSYSLDKLAPIFRPIRLQVNGKFVVVYCSIALNWPL